MSSITGITGNVGGEVARNLLAANLPVRAVVRDARKAEAWAKRGCEITREQKLVADDAPLLIDIMEETVYGAHIR